MVETKITSKFFDSSNNLGSEGTITPIALEYYSVIDRPTLEEKLLQVIRCISPKLREFYNWEDRVVEVIDTTIGSADTYDVQAILKRLEEKYSSEGLNPVEKLIERTLWLISFDAVDPESLSQIRLPEMFKGLHIDEPMILPEARWGGGTNHISMRMYLGPEKFIRIHVYPESEQGANEVNGIDLAHEHDGASAGIILAGQLVNQHYELPNLEKKGELPLYLLGNSKHGENLGNAGRVNRVFTQIGSTTPKRISSRVYNAGDAYFFNGSTVRDADHISNQGVLMETDFLGPHNVATRGYTVTLFFNHTPENAPDTFALFPADSPESIEVPYNSKNRTLGTDEALALAEKTAQVVDGVFKREEIVYAKTFFDRAEEPQVTNLKARLERLRLGITN